MRLALPKAERRPFVSKPPLILFIVAMILVPALTIASLGLGKILGLPSDLGNIASRLAIGLVWPLMASLGEEFGWRGLLLPLWSRDGSFWKPAIGVGLLWGLWHLPSDWIGLKRMGWWFVPQYLLVGLLNLTLLSVIMAAIQRRGRHDVRLAILFHYSITASAILLSPQGRIEPETAVLLSCVAQAVMLLGCAAFLAVLKPWKDAKGDAGRA